MLEQALDTLLLDQVNLPADQLHVFRGQEEELIQRKTHIQDLVFQEYADLALDFY